MTNEATMKGILHALNSIASSLNPEYQILDERIYDNRQRAFIIYKAKEYIKENRRRHEDYMINFDVNYEQNNVVCTIINRNRKEFTNIGAHQLEHNNKVTNEHIAAALALANALGETIPWLDNIPQPNIVRIGHSIEYEGSVKQVVNREVYEKRKKEGMDFMYCLSYGEYAEKGIIVDDTRANYGLLQRGRSDI